MRVEGLGMGRHNYGESKVEKVLREGRVVGLP